MCSVSPTCKHALPALTYTAAKFRSVIAGKRCAGAAEAGAAAVAADAFSAPCTVPASDHAKEQRKNLHAERKIMIHQWKRQKAKAMMMY